MKTIKYLLFILLLSSCSNTIYRTDKIFTPNLKTPWNYYEIFKDRKGYFIYKENYKKVYFPEEINIHLDTLERK